MVTTRAVTSDDLELICRHREEMFRESNAPDRTEDILTSMTAAFRIWAEPRLRDGRYFGYVLEEDGAVIAGIGLMAIDWPPHPSHPSEDKRGYVLNVFVEPSHRRRGLAHRLMNLAESDFRRLGISFGVLHATRMGRPLYEQMGWGTTSEMTKVFVPEQSAR